MKKTITFLLPVFLLIMAAAPWKVFSSQVAAFSIYNSICEGLNQPPPPPPGSTPTPTAPPYPFPTPTPTPPAQGGAPSTIYIPLLTRHSNPTDILLNAPDDGRISSVQIITTQVARYERFELQFAVQTSATYPYLPFDNNPPPGVPASVGITANALFSNDGWQTFSVQPAFLYQPYTHNTIANKDHFIPDGGPRWTVRFAPQEAGDWQVRLCVEDSLGVVYYPDLSDPALSFSVSADSANPFTQRGFVRVSPTDSRYFAFDNGEPFVGLGFNDGYGASAAAEAKMQLYEQNRMNFMRIWMSGDGINGSQWTSWDSHHLEHNGYIPGVYFDIENTYNGADVSMVLDSSNPCYFADFWQEGVPALPSTTYNLTARVKLAGVTGPAAAGDYGFVVKQAGWLSTSCNQPNNGTLVTTPIAGTTDWVTINGSYTTRSNQYWLDNLYLTLQNATGGVVYIDDVRVWQANDPLQINILREPNANSHWYFDPMSSALWDRYIQSAEQHGVYFKLVIDEKNEWIRNHITPEGAMTSESSNNNFYAAPGTKSRWLQEAWWRYLIARWGYSTAIHSFEYINEGDPYNGNLYAAANSMAEYFDQHDPSQHMVTVSFWASFPNREFWSNPQYAAIDYADLHAYISTGWGLTASFLSQARTETNPAHIHSGNASARIGATTTVNEGVNPRSLVIQGQGEWLIRYWMKADSFDANCPYSSTGGMQRVRWQLDGGTYWGGREGVVPFNELGKDFICTSPDGTYNWTQFSSDRDREGVLLPLDRRLVLSDDNPHELALRLENANGVAGSAWIDDIEIVSPSGEVQTVIGEFDVTVMDEDTAWYNRAYAEVWGADSLVGARKPLVRGETGVDTLDEQMYQPDLLLDTEGIWLHNNVWGQINAGGMYDLFWWSTETIPPSLYDVFLTFALFMDDIPLDNGHYRDAPVQTTAANLRVWGQRDDVNGRIHLWVQNTEHTWKRVVYGQSITPISGNFTIPDVPAGNYTVQWWDTYAAANPVFLTQTVSANGSLTLTLPSPLTADVAVKISRAP